MGTAGNVVLEAKRWPVQFGGECAEPVGCSTRGDCGGGYVTVSRSGALVLRSVLHVSGYLVTRGERRVVVLIVNLVDHSTRRKICHREGVPPLLVVVYPKL